MPDYNSNKEEFDAKMSTLTGIIVDKADSSSSTQDLDGLITEAGRIVKPSGNINITTTNSVDVTQYATAQVVDPNLGAGNIKANTSVLGIPGNFTSDATAAASDIADGKTAYVNGQLVVGTYVPSKPSYLISNGDAITTTYFNTDYDLGTEFLSQISYPDTDPNTGLNVNYVGLGYFFAVDLTNAGLSDEYVFVWNDGANTVPIYSTTDVQLQGLTATTGWNVSYYTASYTVTMANVMSEFSAIMDNIVAKNRIAFGGASYQISNGDTIDTLYFNKSYDIKTFMSTLSYTDLDESTGLYVCLLGFSNPQSGLNNLFAVDITGGDYALVWNDNGTVTPLYSSKVYTSFGVSVAGWQPHGWIEGDGFSLANPIIIDALWIHPNFLNIIDEFITKSSVNFSFTDSNPYVYVGINKPSTNDKLWLKTDLLPNTSGANMFFTLDNTFGDSPSISSRVPSSAILPHQLDSIGGTDYPESIVVSVGTKLFIFYGQTYNNAVSVYDSISDTVTTLDNVTVVPPLLAIPANNKIYMFYKTTISTFDPYTYEMIEVISSHTLPMYYPDSGALRNVGIQGATVNNDIYLFGGMSDSSTYSKTIYKLQTSNNTLSTLSTQMTSALNKPLVVAVKNKIYIFGGSNSSGSISTQWFIFTVSGTTSYTYTAGSGSIGTSSSPWNSTNTAYLCFGRYLYIYQYSGSTGACRKIDTFSSSPSLSTVTYPSNLGTLRFSAQCGRALVVIPTNSTSIYRANFTVSLPRGNIAIHSAPTLSPFNTTFNIWKMGRYIMRSKMNSAFIGGSDGNAIPIPAYVYLAGYGYCNMNLS